MKKIISIAFLFIAAMTLLFIALRLLRGEALLAGVSLALFVCCLTDKVWNGLTFIFVLFSSVVFWGITGWLVSYSFTFGITVILAALVLHFWFTDPSLSFYYSPNLIIGIFVIAIFSSKAEYLVEFRARFNHK